MSQFPITFTENLQLQKLGISSANIGFGTLTMESDKYICVCDTTVDPPLVIIIDIANPTNVSKYPIKADSARMNPSLNLIALKAGKNIQVYDAVQKKKVKSYVLPIEVKFWKWISSNMIALVTENSVYHWKTDDNSEAPIKMFDRHESMMGTQIISYKTDSSFQWLALVGISAQQNRIVGAIQLYSVKRCASQPVEGHSCSFTDFTIEGNNNPSNIFSFCVRTAQSSKLNIIEMGTPASGDKPFSKRSVDIPIPPDGASDFPISMHSEKESGIVFIITKMGYLYMYELENGSCIFVNRISQEPMFLSADLLHGDGFICVNRLGSVSSVRVNKDHIVPYLISKQMEEVAFKLASRAGYPGAESAFIARFNDLFSKNMFVEAAKVAAKSTGTSIRNPQTIARFQALAPTAANQPVPILSYFSTLLEHGKLNAIESIELCKPVFLQGKKSLVDKWLFEDKLECTEELGDMAKAIDINLALSIYLRCNCHNKVIQCFGETGQIQKILLYAKKVGFQPDYVRILRTILYSNPDAGLQFAKSIVQEDTDGIDINGIANCFIEAGLNVQCSSFMLEALKKDLPEQSDMQTKLIEMNIVSAPQAVESIFANNILTHFDKPHIAKLCEQAGLLQRALQFFSDIYDIKRAIVQTHLINPDWLLIYFGSLSVDDSLSCLKAMLEYNLRQNLQIVVRIAIKYNEQLGAASIIRLFESFKSFEGLFLFLSSIVNSSQDAEVHLKYIIAACKTGQIKEVERICKESNYYDPEKVKNFLKESKLSDQIPLIIVCDRFNFVEDLVLHLHKNNLLRYIEIYVHKVNPSRLPGIVGALLDVDCQEDFVKNMMVLCPPSYSMDALVEEVSKRNRTKLVRSVIENRIASGSIEPSVHSSLAILYIDSNNRPDVFLRENIYYDSLVVGRYCENRDPILACIAYERGGNDDELIRVCTTNSLFKNMSRYVILKKSPELWEKVLNPANDYRRSLIDQIVQSVLADSFDSECISEMVKAFMAADLPNDLIEILEKIVLSDSPYRSIRNLQNLLLLTSIKADSPRILDYINRLDNYDAPNIANVAINNKLYEEAFAIYKKFDVHPSAVEVLVDCIKNLDRAYEYAERVNTPSAWSILGKGQLAQELLKEAIDSFTKADDISLYADVISMSHRTPMHESMVKYLSMVRINVRENIVDSEYAYCLARTNRLDQLNEFLTQPHNVSVVPTGDRLFDDEQYEMAKIFYKYATNYPKLAATHVKLHEFQAAIEMTRKANNTKMWRVIFTECLNSGEYRFAQICAMSLVIHPEELDGIIRCYEEPGLFQELISVLEASVNLERAHIGIFTELSTLYAKYKPTKLRDHLDLYWTRINIPKVTRAAERYHLWSELTFLYDKYEEFDNAILIMVLHPAVAFNEPQFRDIIQRVANQELYYRSISFYCDYKPSMINELLIVLSPRIDHTKTITQLKSYNILPMCKNYLVHAQKQNLSVVNEALNSIYIEEEAYDDLKTSISSFTDFDALKLAQLLENHTSVEFRRISNMIYKSCNRWSKSIELAKKNGLNRDAVIYAAESGDPEAAQSLLEYFISINRPDYVVFMLHHCYDILRPDCVMEACWLNNMSNYSMPYMIQTLKEYSNKLDSIEAKQKVDSHGETEQSSFFTPGSQLMIGGGPGSYIQATPNVNGGLYIANKQHNIHFPSSPSLHNQC